MEKPPCRECPYAEAAWMLNAHGAARRGAAALPPPPADRRARWPGWGKLVILCGVTALFTATIFGLFVIPPGALGSSGAPAPPATFAPPGSVPVERRCPRCGNSVRQPDSRFCRLCGHRLPAF